MASTCQKQKSTNLAESLRVTLESSSIHSIRNIVNTKYVSIKIMWIVCLLCSACYSVYSINQTVQDFLKRDVISTTRENYENPLTFPIISICNVNFFSSKTSKEMIRKLFKQTLDQNYTEVSNKLNFYYNRYSYILNVNSLNESFKQKLGYSADELIVSCIFNYHDCNIADDFVQYFDPMYGSCLKFNINGNKSISSTGSMNGLQLELFIEATKQNNNLFTMSNSIYLFINNQTKFASYYYDGLAIPPGQLTSIMLAKYSISKQPNPYSNCIDQLNSIDSYPSLPYKKTFQANNNIYRRDDCLNMCYQLYLGERCNCFDLVSVPFPGNLRSCLNSTDQECNNRIWTEFLKNNAFNECDCPYSCTTTDYTYATSQSDFPTISYANHLLADQKLIDKFGNQTQITYDDLKSRIASVNLFYNQLVKTVIKEEPKMQLVDLISSIGGLLGLFLGMSFLSFIEFFDIFSQIIFALVLRKLRYYKSSYTVN